MSLAAAAAQAAPVPVRLGTESFVLDSPPGFTDSMPLSSPRLRELAESLTSASNRVLLFALTDADLRGFMAGDWPEYRRYMVIVTPARLERERVDDALFTALVRESLRDLGAPVAEADYRKHLDAVAEGKPSLLEELRREPARVSVLQGTRVVVPGTKFWQSETSKYFLSTTTLLLLRGKVLQLAVFSSFESPRDLEWIRAVTERWADDLVQRNSR